MWGGTMRCGRVNINWVPLNMIFHDLTVVRVNNHVYWLRQGSMWKGVNRTLFTFLNFNQFVAFWTPFKENSFGAYLGWDITRTGFTDELRRKQILYLIKLNPNTKIMYLALITGTYFFACKNQKHKNKCKHDLKKSDPIFHGVWKIQIPTL